MPEKKFYLDLNFAKKRRKKIFDIVITRPFLFLGIILAVILFIEEIRLYSERKLEIKRMEERIGKERARFKKFVQMGMEAKGIDPKQREEIKKKVILVNTIIEERNFSVYEIMDQMENILPKDAFIASLEYANNKEARELHILGYTKTPKALKEFINGLQESSFFKKTELISQTQESGGIRNGNLSIPKLRFQIKTFISRP